MIYSTAPADHRHMNISTAMALPGGQHVEDGVESIRLLIVCSVAILSMLFFWMVYATILTWGKDARSFRLALLCLSFATCSWAMNVLNKALVEILHAPSSTAAAQMLIASIGTILLAHSRLTGDAMQMLKWSMVPMLFFGMLVSSFFTFEYLTLSMLMVIRNLGPLVTLPVEILVVPLDKQPGFTKMMFIALLVILAGAMVYVGQIKASGVGCALAFLNMALAVADRVAQRRLLTSECQGLSTETCVLLNNVLGFLPTLAFGTITGEVAAADVHLRLRTEAMLLLLLSGVIGSFMCYVAIAVQREVSATSFMVLQNTVRMAVVSSGIVFFQDPFETHNVLGLVLSFGGAIWYGKSQLEAAAEVKGRTHEAEDIDLEKRRLLVLSKSEAEEQKTIPSIRRRAGLTDVRPPYAKIAEKREAVNAVRVIPSIQNYSWGQPFDKSLVAQLCEKSCGPMLDRKLPYAEMWMGTHPTAPSFAQIRGANGASQSTKALKQLIADDPQFWLGRDAARKDLPYLFKVLSVRQALSIQAHPNKKLAEQLHRMHPDQYRDANHKPEICIPLGDFEALVAFRPIAQIRKHVEEYKELQELLGNQPDDTLADMYSRLMRSDPDRVAQQVSSLVERLNQREPLHLSKEENLVLRLYSDYSGDVGIFSVFFLNYVHITADMSHSFIFCAADEPHAYLYGDCVECMALSDNVVRAGLTPKFKDVETLLGMMTYRDDLLSSLVSTGERISNNVLKYSPPVDDFIVYEVEGGGVCDPLNLLHASICVCVVGSFSLKFNAQSAHVEEISRGDSWFCRAGTQLDVVRSEPGARLYIASY